MKTLTSELEQNVDCSQSQSEGTCQLRIGANVGGVRHRGTRDLSFATVSTKKV
jgi:hypothetical protein